MHRLRRSRLRRLRRVNLPVTGTCVLTRAGNFRLVVIVSHGNEHLRTSRCLSANARNGLFTHASRNARHLLNGRNAVRDTKQVITSVAVATVLTKDLSRVVRRSSSSTSSQFNMFFRSSRLFRVRQFLSTFFTRQARNSSVYRQVRRCHVNEYTISSNSSCLLVRALSTLQRIMIGRPTRITLISARSRNSNDTRRFCLIRLRAFLGKYSLLNKRSNVVNFYLCTVLLWDLYRRLHVLTQRTMSSTYLI